MDLPSGLLAAHRSLQIDERGLIRMIRLGAYHATGAYHCLVSWGEHMAAVAGGVVGYVAREFFGDCAYYRFAEDIGTDPVLTDLPPPGTQVWQRTPQGVWRTSRIRRYAAAIAWGPWSYQAILEPAGPAAGVPIPGDSGSICWIRVGASWLVLGVVSHPGSVTVSRPRRLPTGWNITPIAIPAGADEQNPYPEATPDQLRAPWENQGEEPGTNAPAPSEPAPPPAPAVPSTPSCPLLIDVPLDAQDVMSPHAAQPDGQPDQIVDVPFDLFPGNIQSIVVTGEGGDEWRWPDTGHWWHIRARLVDDFTLRLWMGRSRPCDTVWVQIQHSGGVGSGRFPVLTAPPPDRPTAPPPAGPTAPPPAGPTAREAELAESLAAAQREIHRLEAHIAELAALRPDAERWRALRKLMSED